MLSRLAHLPRDARDTLFLLAVVAWVVLPQVANLPWWCSAMTAGVLLWRAGLAIAARPLPGRWVILGVLALAVGATLATHRTVLGRDAGVTLIVVLLALKTLELRARRDAFVIFFLGFFTMLTNFFFSQSLLVAGAMLIALLGLLTALVNAHMPVGRPALLESARTAGWMALLGAPIMAALFVLFPRMAPLWGIPNDAMTGRSGLSSTMQIGNLAKLALDDSIALRVRFAGDTAPPQQDLYFRGPVMSSFDGREWKPLQPTFTARYQLPSGLRTFGTPVRYEVTMEPNNRPWLFVLEAAPTNPVLPGFETFQTSDLQWFASRPITDLVRYRAESYVDFRHGPQSFVASVQDFTELPPGFDPRTRELAQQLRREAQGDTGRLVLLAMERLRRGGYTYTLEPGVYGRDTADEFWFDRKEGFCEHIASAFAILMRAANVPARVVTGYQGGERNSVDGYWVVRQSDAHAWTEVWHAARGWVRVDPTSAVAPGRTGASLRLQAPAGVMASAIGSVSPQFAAQLRAAWEALNNGWNQWVLNYTQSKQLDLLRNVGFESPSWEDLSYVLLGLIVLVSLLGAAWTLWERSRQDPWLRLLHRAQRRLQQAGVASPAAAAPRQLAELMRARHGDAAQAAAAWLLRLEALRYARAPREDLAALRREYRTLAWPA